MFASALVGLPVIPFFGYVYIRKFNEKLNCPTKVDEDHESFNAFSLSIFSNAIIYQQNIFYPT